MAEKLSQAMEIGLRHMAKALTRMDAVMPYPTDNTGKALERRGLIEFVRLNSGGWRTYRLTPAGRAALEREPNDAG